MLRLTVGALALVVSLLTLHERAFACATLRATGRIDVFGCNCSTGLESPITVVTGTALVGNGRATPTLTSLIVELQARQGGVGIYQPVARQVLSADGTDFPPPRSVATCKGPVAAGPVPGRITLIDQDEQPLSFDDVKHIPDGVTPINFVATFAGPLPQLKPGSHARLKVYTTAINTDQPHTCTIDADGDTVMDSAVKTLIFQKTVRVPTTSFLITP
jgi:hypothetical protein